MQNEKKIYDLAIIGGGAGGVLAALQALRRGSAGEDIVLLEPRATVAQGVAYSTRFAEHLLNVPAGRMSAFSDSPEEFLDFLIEADPEDSRAVVADAFTERLKYGAYLRHRLEEALTSSLARFDVLHEEVLGMDSEGNHFKLLLKSGETLCADSIVLAVGNSPKKLPARGAASLPPGLVVDAWDFDAVRRIPTQAAVCIAGSGLSMVDAVMSLAANGHRGTIQVSSRHALLPLVHTEHVATRFDARSLIGLTLRARMRALRTVVAEEASRGVPWQAVMESARPIVQSLWRTLSHNDQRRFLRHVARYWDVHRHRIAPQVYDEIESLRTLGQLELHRGRIDSIVREGTGARVTIKKHDGRLLHLDADRIVNATGVEMRADLMRNALVANLLGKGQARPGPHGIGLDTTLDGSLVDANGHVTPKVMVLGSLRIGTLWESIAVPELREQAAEVVGSLFGRLRR